ncbi:MAG: ABC transporter ATP-binding protein [Lachnospiraceae bacterium]|nr:ABC transporter ATP-binding protein [Lachnospiraceae bacterium]
MTDYLQCISYILSTVGLWGIFGKCGVKSFWALIPFAREYQISRCADKEQDGRNYCLVAGVYYLLDMVMLFFTEGHNRTRILLTITSITLFIIMLIYMIRVYLGLVKVFGRNRKWVVPLIVFEGPTLLLWGISPKFVPSKKVADLTGVTGAKETGMDLDAIEDGLTVNIKERTAIDFFRKKTLLKDIHMSIPKGHMVLLLGGSGAGKTTYLNAVTGYEKANASIMLGQNDVYGDYARMMYDIGFVPQQDLIRGNDTVALTLSDAASLRLPSDVSAKEKKERIAKVLEQFGLTTVKNSLVEKLSGGQRKRLSIAMEFISDPSLFILDEPDSGLDGVVARSLFEKLRSIADEGKIVVVITHTPDRVIDLFDDVIVLAKDATRTGRLAWYGPVNEAYEFFGKKSMEEILLSINQKDEGGEGRADEFVEKYADRIMEKAG